MNAAPRVLLVSYDDTPPLGGQGRVVAGMRRGLQAAGAVVDSVSGRGEHAIDYRRVTGLAPWDLSIHLWRHPDLLRRHDVDVVHAHGGPGGVFLPRRLEQPLIYTAHHTYWQAHSRASYKRLASPLEMRGYRLARRVLAVSRSTADALVGAGVPAAKVEVLAPGIDLPPAGESRHEPGRMLFVGRLEPGKGVLDAVRVIATLARGDARVRGVIVGSGSLAAAVRREIETAFPGRIEMRGELAESELRAEYARADVVLMPSQYEGLGLVALEAMAHGCAVVGYDVAGLRDHRESGMRLVAPGDIDSMAAAAAAIGSDESARRQLGEAGEAYVRHNFAWDRHAARLLEIYRGLS